MVYLSSSIGYVCTVRERAESIEEGGGEMKEEQIQ